MNLLDAFLEQVRLRPDAPAVEEDGRVLSYAELLGEVDALAADLRSARLCGVRIALDLPRSAAFVIAVLASWRCGSSFLPIHGLPEDRRDFILDDAEVAGILTWEFKIQHSRFNITQTKSKIKHSKSNTESELPASAALHLSSFQACNLSTSSPEAWLISTSGSSGRPKSVSVGHGGLLAVIRQQIAAFELGPGSRCLWMLSPLFDASLSDIFTALCCGATLVVAAPCETSPERLLKTLADRRISYLDIPPSLLRLISPEEAPECLLTLGFGGEVCPRDTVRAWSRRVRLFNLYGPTEASICCAMVRCGEDWSEGDIGRPLEGAEFRLDPESGELLIGGPCLALGYWRRPELDAAKFTVIDGRRFYRSGDRAQVLPDGAWRFLGRLDRQVKVRGRLVECGEVESALLRLPGVDEAAVFAVGPRLLCAYAGRAENEGLRQALLAELPEWMIPAKFLRLPQLPRNASGKIDYPRLQPARKQDGPHASLRQLVEDYFGYAIDPELPLRRQGLDSLGAFELAARLQGERFAWRPEDLMQDLPLAEIKPRLLPMSVESLGRQIQDSTFNIQHKANKNKDLTLKIASGGRTSILLTGATGFLGLALLGELQRRLPQSRFLLLLRGGGERLRRIAEKRGVALDFSRLDILDCDLNRHDLGLDQDARRKALEAEIFIHAAAELSSSRSFAEIAAVNVAASLALARLYLEGAGRRFHFVSSLAVFACSDAPSAKISADSEPAGNIHGAYAQSKLTAECLLRREIGFEGGLRLVRPALIGGAAKRDDLPKNDFFTWMLEALARQPLDPAAVPAGLAIAVAPLESYAAALAGIVAEEPSGPVSHLAPECNLDLRQLCAASCALAGRPGLDLDSWRRAQQGTPLPAVLNGLFAPRQDAARAQDLFLASGYDFDGSLPAPDENQLLAWLLQAGQRSQATFRQSPQSEIFQAHTP
ncbi:MAG: hypothetical protein RL095_166 [Verrucomicrobiota bacterium]|jgi:amino acid adenylation domain-containing protein